MVERKNIGLHLEPRVGLHVCCLLLYARACTKEAYSSVRNRNLECIYLNAGVWRGMHAISLCLLAVSVFVEMSLLAN